MCIYIECCCVVWLEPSSSFHILPFILHTHILPTESIFLSFCFNFYLFYSSCYSQLLLTLRCHFALGCARIIRFFCRYYYCYFFESYFRIRNSCFALSITTLYLYLYIFLCVLWCCCFLYAFCFRIFIGLFAFHSNRHFAITGIK